ncbi:MAG: Uma2 family endonuclease [Chloroflexi bacterium]|nr:Uma2 family endonuclease [Chloroflexota bacterium]
MTAAQPKPRQLRESATHTKTEPTWEIAYLFPLQGAWSEEEYMALRPSRIIEYSHGHLEVHDVPTQSHQLILSFIYQVLLSFITPQKLGVALFAPLRVRLWSEKYREPDIVFMLAEHASRRGNDYWQGADLAVEIVSEGDDNRDRDLQKKREEYAQAGIAEYWIVDLRDKLITVLRLQGEQYALRGEFKAGETATSALLPGLSVNVADVFAAAEL